MSATTLGFVLEALRDTRRDMSGQSWENVLHAAAGGTLEVVVTFESPRPSYSLGGALEEVPPFAEAFDTAAPSCWDACNGITILHRPGWCRINPEHADLDCGCSEPDYEEES